MSSNDLREQLKHARLELDGVHGISQVGEPRSYRDNDVTAFAFVVDIDQDHPHLPRQTAWWLVVDQSFPKGKIVVYPDVHAGIEATFPHQNMNRAGDDKLPWRTGEICLKGPESFLGRGLADPDPVGHTGRVRWYGERAVEWCRAAASDKLLQLGDPFELPHFDPGLNNLAFIENAESLGSWRDVSTSCGLLTHSPLSSGRLTLIRSFCDSRGRQLIEPSWGTWADELNLKTQRGIWVKLADVPTVGPYGAPQTWSELRQCIESEGLDFVRDIGPMLDQLRNGQRVWMVVGFPIPETVGEDPARLHWQPLALPELARTRRPPKGFASPLKHDLTVTLTGRRRVEWQDSRNWDLAERSRRGVVSRDLQSARIAVLGVGALGSTVAELLARSGCCDLVVVDPDVLHIGNIVRHSLTATDVGEPKAVAVARRIEGCNPNATVRACVGSIADPPDDILANVDIVVDCTGEDDVLETLSRLVCDAPVVWVSASVGFAARRLYLFIAKSQSFPHVDFKNAVEPWLDEDRSAHDLDDFPWDAVGCWHPTFPADATDMQLLAVVAVKEIAAHLKRDTTSLAVFEQSTNPGGFAGLTRLREGPVERA